MKQQLQQPKSQQRQPERKIYRMTYLSDSKSVGDYVSIRRKSKREQNYVPSSLSETEESNVKKLNCKPKNSKNEARKK